MLLGLADLGLVNLKLAPEYAEEQAKQAQVTGARPGSTTSAQASAQRPTATPGPSVAVAPPPKPTPTPEPQNTAPEPTTTTSALPVVSVAAATPPAPTSEPEPPPAPKPPPAVASGDKPAAISDILFEIDSNLLTLSAKSTLDEVLKQLKANPSLRIHLRGHSDQLGSREHNLELSRKRAAAVENFFHANGIPHSRITTEAVGGMKPADSTNTPTAWARNRRVEIEWR
ncbi:OmpA family protein [Polyangium sorediatum]|uniref:OmpA family protein n=1 Tax=Polyangium sorediatum TaxID=889274 RepID=A0ABT6NSH5_9BACT|nr:OmpA family protein [Polyangium sorediatum]MDI1431233.1 OmpA family protein [Polyangium sorediatum]